MLRGHAAVLERATRVEARASHLATVASHAGLPLRYCMSDAGKWIVKMSERPRATAKPTAFVVDPTGNTLAMNGAVGLRSFR